MQEIRKVGKEVWDNYFVADKILKGIRKRSNQDNDTKFEHLYSLLSREDLIYQAIINIKNNRGTSTQGIDGKTLDAMSKTDVLELADRIKKGLFRFKPVKRIMIPKPGKSELRPLGIPSFEDRIVQEMMRMILEAIYEPVFEKKHDNVNYGFRAGKSTHMAIDKIKTKAQNTEWAIEGDIKGAYDNVNHERLIEIIQEKITDKQFLALLRQGLKCGTIHKGNYAHSMLGTPQGAIASPILFNIYMSKFDEFILEIIQGKINEWNKEEGRKVKPRTKIYQKFESTSTSSKRVLARIIAAEQAQGKVSFKQWDPANQKRFVEVLKKKRDALKAAKKVPYLDKKNAILRFCYVRYADDWVFFTNCSKARTEQIKEEIARFLLDDLKLTLSQEKTKVTNAKKERVKFLGFSLCYYADTVKIMRITNQTRLKERFNKNRSILIKNRMKSRSHIKRTTGNLLVIGIDQDRLDTRLAQKRFTDSKALRGHRKAEWTVLSDYEIIMRHNYVIRGLVNYYAKTIRDFSILNKYIYLLNYSCLHTLANKHRLSIKKVIKQYGLPAKTTQLNKDKEKGKEITLLDYSACKEIANKLNSNTDKDDNDFLSVRVNWRTVYKLNKYCVICGSERDVQMHHVKHVRKMGEKNEGFGEVISMLNRRQICVCRSCHRRIHLGLYDGIGLSDLYDPDLATA